MILIGCDQTTYETTYKPKCETSYSQVKITYITTKNNKKKTLQKIIYFSGNCLNFRSWISHEIKQFSTETETNDSIEVIIFN